MSYVMGVDLGTSAVKVLLVNKRGEVVANASKAYPLIQQKSNYSEQNPDDWVEGTIGAIKEVVKVSQIDPKQIEGLSFSGQMHGLVLLDDRGSILRPAILWNDTRTTEECKDIYEKIGEERLLSITKNHALEGFTLPKILWVKKHEPHIFSQIHTILLPKDYVRFRLTGEIHMDFSDAAGTLLLDITHQKWSSDICETFYIREDVLPPLVYSDEQIGFIKENIADEMGLSSAVKVFAGGADNACGAIGSGILNENDTLCSIGTSGVILSFEEEKDIALPNNIHYFNHAVRNAYYAMGVTLSAGYSLSWLHELLGKKTISDLLLGIEEVPVGSNGLLFTPYLVGERTPHSDANIRASFIGIDSSHGVKDFARSVLEGITFSLNESLQVLRTEGKEINQIVSIGGGAKNDTWLQMQADIFNASIVKLSTEQGPGLGAAMLAAYGCGWFHSLEDCAGAFLKIDKTILPIEANVEKYEKLFLIYQDIYYQTKNINERLTAFRN